MSQLFGLKIYTGNKEVIIDKLSQSDSKIHIISGNAEVLKYPLKDKQQFDLFNKEENIIIADGISVSIPLKKKLKREVERITGIDLMQDILRECEIREYKVYFLGAKEDVLDKMISNVKISYPNLIVSGCHHGYIDVNNCDDLITDINEKYPDVIFVAMGTPMQERFIFKYMNVLPCRLFMGVGGSFDVLSGVVNRCPRWMSEIGVEWLYRITKDPRKIKRLINNVYFTVLGCLKG